ncbi:MAG: thioesterase family protein [Mycobacterium sp.]|nr:thioesterase family protein [Mycobacterium sp.]
MTHVLPRLLAVTPAEAADTFVGPENGPADKRAYGGHLAAQALAAAGQTVDPGLAPTSLHVQFLRGGDAGAPVRYEVQRVYDGRTTASRRVLARQGGRLLVTATTSFVLPTTGPEHGEIPCTTDDPDSLPRTGPIGPAPSLPLDEIDIRSVDDRSAGGFRRRLWWRVTTPLPDDPMLHACAAVYVTDIYGIDPVLQVHGHSMTDRSHHTATTDSSIWFHRPIRADRWNLLESESPAAARGRGVMTGRLFDADGALTATLVQEGLAVPRS